jgi:hypothetical protein
MANLAIGRNKRRHFDELSTPCKLPLSGRGIDSERACK